MMKLQEKLRWIRRERGVSQLEIAEKLEVSRQTVSRWETGTSIPTTENLMRLSALYGIPLDEWMDGDRTPRTLEIQAPDAPPEDTAVNTKSRWRRWGVPLLAFLLGVSLVMGVLLVFRLRERSHTVSTDELEGEVIDFTSAGRLYLFPPIE